MNQPKEAAMKTTRTMVIITLSTLIVIGGVAACRHGHRSGSFDEFDLAAATDRIASRLDMTASQKADLKQMTQEMADEVKAMHAAHENRHQELADLVRQDAIGRDVVDQLIADKLSKMKEMADFAAERLIAFHATLTPEQREMIATRIEKRSSNGCRFGWR
jgi:Spy/CpxP family protein refolding chaperone